MVASQREKRFAEITQMSDFSKSKADSQKTGPKEKQHKIFSKEILVSPSGRQSMDFE
jgi:hypothetical protein